MRSQIFDSAKPCRQALWVVTAVNAVDHCCKVSSRVYSVQQAGKPSESSTRRSNGWYSIDGLSVSGCVCKFEVKFGAWTTESRSRSKVEVSVTFRCIEVVL